MYIKTKKWIPVEKALPELGGNYICTIEFDNSPPYEMQRGTIELLFKQDEGKWFNEYVDEYEDNVTAWLPLITPYKGWR